MRRAVIVLGLAFGLSAVSESRPAAVGADDAKRGEELREAATAGDLARVRALLEAGVPVDAEARYGQTALYFAAEKGRLEIARLLVERGANADVRERFFNTSALDVALQGGHLELARFLLASGARDATSALFAAAERGDVALARAALDTARIEPLELQAARKAAEEKGPAELRELLAKATVAKPVRQPVTVTPDRLRAYAGRYRGGSGPEHTVAVGGSGVVLTTPGAEAVSLAPIGDDRFETADGKMSVQFGGRGGSIEYLLVNREGDLSRQSLVTSDPQPLNTAKASTEDKAARTEPKPWPQFRGPQASGIGDGQGAPLAWNVPKGENVRFKTPIPGIALSSPVIWGERIFLTSATSASGDKTFRTGLYGDGTAVDDTSEHVFRVYALDKSTGRIVWEREAVRKPPTVRRHLKSSLANATPTTDGKHVIALFGAVGLLIAYDFDGKELWRRDVGILDCNDPQSGTAEWGHASSPVIHGDLVIVQGDRRKDSFVAAYSRSTGREAWRVARDETSTWSTPNLLRGPSGDELLTNGRMIRAYDPATGRLLWTLGPNSEVVVATPVVGQGMAFVTAGYPPVRPVYAVRPGHRGDLSLGDEKSQSEAVAWSHKRGGTYIPTPILYRDHLYTVNNNGILTCYRAATGEQVYQTRLGEAGASFAASPVAADGRLYFASETGEVYVLRAGPEQALLTTNVMDEVVMATPAISDGLMVVRTLGHVVGLAESGAATTTGGGARSGEGTRE